MHLFSGEICILTGTLFVAKFHRKKVKKRQNRKQQSAPPAARGKPALPSETIHMEAGRPVNRPHANKTTAHHCANMCIRGEKKKTSTSHATSAARSARTLFDATL